MTVVEHPTLRTAELNRRIAAELGEHACWKSDFLWGAYLTLEFGPRQILIGKNGPSAFGEFRILLDEASWTVERNGVVVLESEDALDFVNNAEMEAVFVGRCLLRVDWRDGFNLAFTDGLVLRCHPETDDEQVFEMRFANGDCVDLYADGSIETESVSP